MNHVFINKPPAALKDEAALPEQAGSRVVAAALLLLIIAVAAAIRFADLGRESGWYDELYSIWVRQLPPAELVPDVLKAGHPPLYNLVGWFWGIGGEGVAWARALSAFLGTATVVLVYGIGRELYSRPIGLLAAALAAVSPFLVWYSRDATSYGWLIALSTLSLFLLLRAVRLGSWWSWAMWASAAAMLLLSHYFAVAVLVAEAASFLVLRREAPLKPWLAAQAALAPLVVIMLFLSRQAGGRVRLGIPDPGALLEGIASAPVLFVTGYGFMGNASSTAILSITLREFAAMVLVTLAVAAALIIFPGFRQRLLTRQTLALGLFVALLIAVTATIQAARDEAMVGRYYAWAAPPFILLMSAFIGAMGRRWALVAGGSLLLMFSFLTVEEFREPGNDDWRQAMSVISQQRQEGDRLFCFPLHHCVVAIDQYLQPALPVAGGWTSPASESVFYQSGWNGYRDTAGQQDELVGEALAEHLAGELAMTSGRLWILTGDGSLGHYPDAPAVISAMPADWQQTGEWNYPPLKLRLFERRPSPGA